MTRLTWQEYFEQFIRVRLQNLAASQASGRELIERLRAIAAEYKRFLFNDNSPLTHAAMDEQICFLARLLADDSGVCIAPGFIPRRRTLICGTTYYLLAGLAAVSASGALRMSAPQPATCILLSKRRGAPN